MNFLRGTVGSGDVEVPGFGKPVPKLEEASEGQRVLVGLRPEHLHLVAGDTHHVELTESLGGVSYAHLTAPTGETMIVEERGDKRAARGDQVGLSVEPGKAYLFDAENEARLR